MKNAKRLVQTNANTAICYSVIFYTCQNAGFAAKSFALSTHAGLDWKERIYESAYNVQAKIRVPDTMNFVKILQHSVQNAARAVIRENAQISSLAFVFL